VEPALWTHLPKTLKRRRPKPGDRWFLDEVFVRIRGKLHYLWRAVDQNGNVLDVLVRSRRNTKAAKRFFRKLLKDLCYVPRVIVTDKLGSYTAAKREILPGVEHRQRRYLTDVFDKPFLANRAIFLGHG
jgi:putative transposase